MGFPVSRRSDVQGDQLGTGSQCLSCGKFSANLFTTDLILEDYSYGWKRINSDIFPSF